MNKTQNIPIFPLNGAIFFPNTDLPLNIFEKKYIKMIDFALSKNKIIGMIQLKENGTLYNKGCLGKITSFNETEDNKYIVNLRGQNIFSIINETKSKHSFNTANISMNQNFIDDKFKFDLNLKMKERLLNLFIRFIKENNYQLNFDFLNKIETPDLIKFISMLGPFSVAEKQMLLESESLKKLYEKLIILFEFNNNNETNIQIIN